MRWRAITAVSVITAALLSLGSPANSREAASPTLPNSMAAIGDSITQAVNVCCWYGNHPGKSWSTGYESDTITSHYERILAANPAIAGNAYNDSVSGAKMADAAEQAATVVSQQAEYVTILMGANDACTSSPETMTPLDQFRSQFEAAMATLGSGLPSDAHIFVASIPNIYRLWQILHTNPLAQAVWWAAQICQSMLSPFNSEEDRLQVLGQVKAYNAVLAQVCGQYANCRFDRKAVFKYRFTTDQVSTLDFFHPSVGGQAALARVTWPRSWWPGT
jgi:lysophospholipase L1-like esterase